MTSPTVAAAAIDMVRLRPERPERALPPRWLGYNSPAPYNVPIEDPALLPALSALQPHYLRFPGGTVSNYYQWRTGQLLQGDHPDSPVYRQYASRSRALHPNGVFIEQFVALSRQLGAELIVVPNLETSSVEEQVAWFASMNANGFVPSQIEMGNEFFLALMMNPVTLRLFPNWDATIRLTKQYVDALRRHIAADARIAVQASGAVFHNPDGQSANPYATDTRLGMQVAQRERQWDADMRLEPWFQAVTLHLYPTIEGSAGAGSVAGMPGNVGKVFAACMARADDGFDRVLSDTIARMPGKEIWVTEWGAFEPIALMQGVPVSFDGVWLHMSARSIMAMLRHPQVTVATNHSLFCDGNLMSAFRHLSDDEMAARTRSSAAASAAPGDYVPINASGLISWFCQASRGPDAHYQRIDVDGARRVLGHGTVPGESFGDVEACLFRRGRQHTLFIQNAGSKPKRVDFSSLAGADTSLSAEVIETPDLSASLQMAAPQPFPLLPSGPVLDVAAYSIAKIVWVN